MHLRMKGSQYISFIITAVLSDTDINNIKLCFV